MILRSSALPASFFALSLTACSGQLVIESAGLEGGGSGCVSSAQCGPGKVCDGQQCVDSDGPCSVANPDGDCPFGRVCQAGICVQSSDGNGNGNGNGNTNNSNGNDNNVTVFDCAQCAAGEWCDGFECVDPADDTAICSESNLEGACPVGEVCVAGACTPIKAGKNDCSAERPSGLCPPAAYCVEGFCLPIDERPCSGVAPDGACPAGQACTGGSCSVVVCSSTAPFGQCTGGLVCLDGVCRPETALLNCEELDCAAANREACTTDPDGIASCGACLPGFDDNGLGTCVPESCVTLGCAAQLRECDTSVVPAKCGECIEGYKDGPFGCEPVVCADLNCGGVNRECIGGATVADPAVCGECVEGFVDDGGSCRLGTCADINADCAALTRECVEGNGSSVGATCGDCIPPAEQGTNGLCTTCDVPGGCQACTVTSNCSNGTFCDPDSGFCAQDCTSDADCVAGGFGSGSQCSPNGRCARTTVGGGVCGAGILEGEIVEPIVAILVDQSGSMREAFAGGWRWFEVERVLFGGTNGVCLDVEDNGNCCTENANNNGCENSPNYAPTYRSRGAPLDLDERGLVTRFQDDIQFTVILYETEGNDLRLLFPDRANVGEATTDPTEALEPGFGTRDQLAAFFAGQIWEGDTPTSNAVFAVDEYLRVVRQARADAGLPVPPAYIVLATDGEPDYADSPETVGCTNPNPTTIAEYRVLEAVDFARREQTVTLQDGVSTLELRGITTFSLSVGADVSLNHFQDVANAGAGVPTMVTNKIPAIDDIGLLPADFTELIQPDQEVLPNSSNPYFDAYTAPSPVYGTSDRACGRDSDCQGGETCEAGYCCDSSCRQNRCVDGWEDTGSDDSGDPRLFPAVDDCTPEGSGTDRMTDCVSRRFVDDYAELFAGLSSRDDCGSSSCALENEVCMGNECVVASCTSAGTTDAAGNQVMAPCFIGNDGQALGSALEGVFNAVLSCTVDLAVADTITSDGVVWLDDDPIPADQWRVIGVNRIEVLGEACETLKDGNSHFLSVEINTCAGGG